MTMKKTALQPFQKKPVLGALPRTASNVDKLVDQFLNSVNEESESSIVDNSRRVHLADNGALLEIADDELLEGDGGESSFRDDFTATIERLDEAVYGPTGEVLGDFDQKWYYREKEAQEAAEEAPHRSINPPSWRRGIIGNFALLIPSIPVGSEGPTRRFVIGPVTTEMRGRF